MNLVAAEGKRSSHDPLQGRAKRHGGSHPSHIRGHRDGRKREAMRLDTNASLMLKRESLPECWVARCPAVIRFNKWPCLEKLVSLQLALQLFG
jgi:hypothetical protein